MAYVYLIKEGESDLYKIGSTKDHPKKRLKQLQTGNPTELNLVTYYQTDNHQKVESLMHISNMGYHVSREWFRFDLSMETEFITECKSKEGAAKMLKEQDERSRDWKDWLKKKT